METIVTAISLAAGLTGIIFGFLQVCQRERDYKRLASHDVKNESEDSAALKSNVDYIKRRVDDVLLEQRDTNKTLSELSERITRVEESAKQAHKRIDGLEHRMGGGEV